MQNEKVGLLLRDTSGGEYLMAMQGVRILSKEDWDNLKAKAEFNRGDKYTYPDVSMFNEVQKCFNRVISVTLTALFPICRIWGPWKITQKQGE